MTTLELKRHAARVQRPCGSSYLPILAATFSITACTATNADLDGFGGNTSAVGGASAAQGSSTPRSSGESGATTAVDTGGTPAQGGRVNSTSGTTSGGTSATGASAPSGGTPAATNGGSSTKTAASGGSSNTGGATTSPAGGRSSTVSGGRAQGGTSAVGPSGGTQPIGRAGAGGKSAAGGSSARGGAGSAQGGATVSAGAPATGGAGGGSGDYRPCPSNGDPCKILPLGDSITYGMQSTDTGGYRVPLFKKVVAASQKITFTGSQKDGPTSVSGSTFPRNHEGHSGWTIDQIAGLVPSPAMSTDIPHIVLLMAGTNDVYASSGQATMPDRLSTLIDKVTTAAPNALLVVATLTPLSNSGWNTTANTYDSKIPAVVQTKVSKGKHVIMVDMAKMPTSQLSDGIHPNDAGYAYMADVWYAAIRDQLPK